MTPRKRSKLGRYNPTLLKGLREAIAKRPEPMFGPHRRMSDGDLMDFALELAGSYFSGALVESFKVGATRELERFQRQTVSVIAANLGATASFSDDGVTTLTMLANADDDTRTAAVQRLVDVGVSVKEATRLISNPQPQGHASWQVGTSMPAYDMTQSLTRH